MKQKHIFLTLFFIGIFLLGAFAALLAYQKNSFPLFQASNIFASDDAEFSANAAVIDGKLTLEARIKPASEDTKKELDYYIAATNIPGQASGSLYFLTAKDTWKRYESGEYSKYLGADYPFYTISTIQYIPIATDTEITNLIGANIYIGYKTKEKLKYGLAYTIPKTIVSSPLETSKWDKELITNTDDLFAHIPDIAAVYEDKTWAKELLEKALEKQPYSAPYYSDELAKIDKEWAKRIITSAIMTYSDPVFESISKLVKIDKDWTKRILEEAIIRNPYFAMKATSSLVNIDIDWAKKQLGDAINNDPDGAATSMADLRIIDNGKWVTGYFQIIFNKAHPNFLWQNMDIMFELDKKAIMAMAPFTLGSDHAPYAFEWGVQYFATRAVTEDTPTNTIMHDMMVKIAPLAKSTTLFQFLQKGNGGNYFTPEEWTAFQKIYNGKQLVEKIPDPQHFMDWNSLMTDPAFEWIVAVPEATVIPRMAQFPDFVPVQLQFIIGRNLFLSGKYTLPQILAFSPTEWTSLVNKMLTALKTQHDTYKDRPIFSGRNVLLLAHGEKLSVGGVNRFGTDATQERIREQGGILSVIRPGEIIPLNKVTESALTAIRNASTDKPFTLLFDGHGDPEGLYFSSGENLNNISTEAQFINVKDLAEALFNRYKNLSPVERKDIIKNPDILIFASCYNHTFLRDLYARLQEKWKAEKQTNVLPLPITIGESEYGQLGNGSNPPYGQTFLSVTLQLSIPNHITTFGDIITEKNKNGDVMPSIYIPVNGNPNQFMGMEDAPVSFGK